MWVVFESTMESAPEFYENWQGVCLSAELSFGKGAVVSEDEWPISFVPNWFSISLLPMPAATFRTVTCQGMVVGLVFEVTQGYGDKRLLRGRRYVVEGARPLTWIEKVNADAQIRWAKLLKGVRE